MLTNEIHKNKKYFIYLILVSVILRLFFWYLIPETRFASDEEGYFGTGIFLYQNGYLKPAQTINFRSLLYQFNL